jgi:hypothetical protein
VISGSLMFISQPIGVSGILRLIKVLLLCLAGINMLVFHHHGSRRVSGGVRTQSRFPESPRAFARFVDHRGIPRSMDRVHNDTRVMTDHRAETEGAT